MSQTSLWALKIQLKTSVEFMFTTRPKKLDTTENKTRKFMNTIRMFGFIFFLIGIFKVIRRLRFLSYLTYIK